MAIQIFTGNVIAVIWDFDQTLIPGYQQKPIFEYFKVNEDKFWKEVSLLTEYYKQERIIVSADTVYLNHILTYVREGHFKGLNNFLLGEFGKELEFYPGLPDFLEDSKRTIETNEDFLKHDISVEHYIVSTGLRQIIRGSKIASYIKDIWACEFIENPAPPGFNADSLKKTPISVKKPIEISQVGYFLDNTTKTRAIWEINKGTNIDQSIGVNDKIAPEDRRVPLKNMIYIADGPSDIPVFSIINMFGGRTLGVYNQKQERHFEEVKKLSDQGRVQHFSPADYSKGSDAYRWIIKSMEEIAETIVEIRKRMLFDKVGKSAKHITD